MKSKIVLNKEEIANEYVNSHTGIEKLAIKYHVGKLKIKEILKEFNIDIKKRGGQLLNETFIINDPKIKKYINSNDYHYIVIDKNTDWQSNDIENRGGFITSYIKKQYNIDVPPLYERDKYYKLTGDYWWEQFVSYEKVPNKPTKKCPYCSWETIDTENKSGVFETHLLKAHHIDKIIYLKEHPEEKAYFYAVNPIVNLQMEEDTSKYVKCQICGCIDDENRPNQETFECIECGYNNNADFNAAINIRNRVCEAVLRNTLLKQLDNGAFEPKKLKREKVKEVLLSFRRNLQQNARSECIGSNLTTFEYV